MGVTFDLIAANHEDVEGLGTFTLYPTTDTISTKVLDPVTLATLQAIAMESEWEEACDKFYTTPVYDGGIDGPWIYELPGEFVSRLAKLSDTELGRIALDWHSWASSEGKQSTWWDLNEVSVVNLLADIRDLAARADLLKKKLFLRMAL